MALSNMNKAILLAYERGYRVRPEGTLISFTGRILKPRLSTTGYYRANYTTKGVHHTLMVHKLQAYQKYGDKIFEEGICVRHLDGNCRNNRIDNIGIGSQADNMNDKPKDVRTRVALTASTTVRVLTDLQIKEARNLRAEGWTYTMLMDKFNITSKGSMWEILNRDYITEK